MKLLNFGVEVTINGDEALSSDNTEKAVPSCDVSDFTEGDMLESRPTQ
jgi:hypothetical protein